MTDLTNFSLDELKDLHSKIDENIKARKKEEIGKVQQQILALAASLGMTLEQIMKGKNPAKQVEPRFRHPKKPELQWSGRGRKPLWIQEYLDASGETMDSLLIKAK